MANSGSMTCLAISFWIWIPFTILLFLCSKSNGVEVDTTYINTGSLKTNSDWLRLTKSTFAEEVLNNINSIRMKHNAPNLTLNANLMAVSQEVADDYAYLWVKKKENSIEINGLTPELKITFQIYQTEKDFPKEEKPDHMLSSASVEDKIYKPYIQGFFDYDNCQANMSAITTTDHEQRALAMMQIAELTQLIWKNTSFFGIGYAETTNELGNYEGVMVLAFWPKGHYLMQFYCFENIEFPGKERPQWDKDEWRIPSNITKSSSTTLSSNYYILLTLTPLILLSFKGEMKLSGI